MNSNWISKKVIATFLLASFFSASSLTISEAAKKPKAAGRTSNATPNTILNGKGTPASSLGINGDFYIDTRSLLIYGPKKSNKWPLPQSLQGPAGTPGTDGKNGSEGKTISNAGTVAGPTGAQGEKGDKGDTGPAGAPGAIGLTGAKGDTGATGPSGGGGGTPGPTGATGPQGIQGETGATGPQGLIGLTGVKGETGTAGSIGAAGATGPSNVYRGTINFSDISGGVGTSQTSTLSGFKAGSSYLVDISFVVYQPTRNLDTLMPLGLVVTNNVGTATIWYKYETFKGRSYRNGASSERYEYTVLAQLVLDGTSSSDYSINLQLSVGIDTSSFLARTDATFTAILVGAVGTL